MTDGFGAIAVITGEKSAIQLSSYLSLALTDTPAKVDDISGDFSLSDLYINGKLSIFSIAAATQHFKSYSTIEYRNRDGELFVDLHQFEHSEGSIINQKHFLILNLSTVLGIQSFNSASAWIILQGVQEGASIMTLMEVTDF